MSLPNVSPYANSNYIDYNSINIPDPKINFPGILNIVKAPIKMTSNITHFIKCFILWDIHGMKDGLLSFISSFNAFINAACYLSGAIIDYFSKDFPKTFITNVITITGFIICGIEFLNECYRLIQQLSFHKKLFFSSDIEILKKSSIENIETFLKNLEKILEKNPNESLKTAYLNLQNELNSLKIYSNPQDVDKKEKIIRKIEAISYLSNIIYIEKNYLSLNDNEIKKVSETWEKEQINKCTKGTSLVQKKALIKPKSINLARRISPLLFKSFKQESLELQKDLNEILTNTSSDLDVIGHLQKSKQFFNKIQIQSIKAMKIHGIALFSLGLAITSIITSLFTFPLALPIIFSASSAVMGIYTGFAKEVILPADGYNYHWYQLFPKFIQNAFNL